MAALATGDLELPDHIMTPWLGKVKGGSVLAALSPSEAQKFGTGKAMVFDSGEAELVSEGGQKSSNDITKSTQSVEPHKFQKTVRMNEEVLWADEDHQLKAVEEILSQIQPALSRALVATSIAAFVAADNALMLRTVPSGISSSVILMLPLTCSTSLTEGVRPSAPGMPCGPCSPCGPVSPCGPCSPCGPVSPCGIPKCIV